MRICAQCNKNPVKEAHRKFCSLECANGRKRMPRKYNVGDTEIRWITFGSGIESKPTPYRYIYVGGDVNRFQMEHRVVMEAKMGRKLKIGDRVFHINGDTLDNGIENLRAYDSIEAYSRAKSVRSGHSREDQMFIEDHMRFLDEIFGFSKIIMQPCDVTNPKYGVRTIWHGGQHREEEDPDWGDDILVGALAREPKGHMVDCYVTSPYHQEVYNEEAI